MSINTFLETDLFRLLTEEERLSVERYSAKTTAALPKFFNAGTQVVGDEPRESISTEFEAFLILQALQSSDKLSNAIKWFTEAADLQIKRKDRDELLELTFSLEKADVLDRLLEIRSLVDKYVQFRREFEIVETSPQTDALEVPIDRFSGVPEIGLIMRDSQAAMGEISAKLSRLEHLIVETEVLDRERLTRVKSQESVGGIDDDRIAEELLSWRDVISEIQAAVAGAS
jgi:hypothetical protein